MTTRMEQRRMERMRAKTISAIFVLMALLIAFMLGYYFGGTAETAEEPEPVQYIPDEPKVVTLPEIEEPEEPELVSIGTFTVYAYCPCETCCGQWSGGPTASGTMPEEGRTVAADWDVLPAGTEIYLDGIGWRTVEDTGSGITGDKLDLYMDSHAAALKFGVREIEVWTAQKGGSI